MTILYNISKGEDWEISGHMKIPRRKHTCVSISTPNGERILALGGINQMNQKIGWHTRYDLDLEENSYLLWSGNIWP